MLNNLYLTNSLSKKKEKFVPTNTPQNEVKMYVCGVTPYDYAHLGHGRCYTVFDLLYRLLKFMGYQVNYTRNFTDIDDKLINKAQKELGDGLRYKEIADKFIAAYQEDMQNLKAYTKANKLGKKYNYSLIYCDAKGVNRFLIHNDLIKDKNLQFKNFGDIAKIYKPPNYGAHKQDPYNRQFISFEEAINV